ncbi:hypothetical protein EDC01DRAFT_635872 [Geopyxis carbonaria]|nr:hypothetical protein EDC01DRAFT_635872 [Geopyxis carbonaria]
MDDKVTQQVSHLLSYKNEQNLLHLAPQPYQYTFVPPIPPSSEPMQRSSFYSLDSKNPQGFSAYYAILNAPLNPIKIGKTQNPNLPIPLFPPPLEFAVDDPNDLPDPNHERAYFAQDRERLPLQSLMLANQIEETLKGLKKDPVTNPKETKKDLMKGKKTDDNQYSEEVLADFMLPAESKVLSGVMQQPMMWCVIERKWKPHTEFVFPDRFRALHVNGLESFCRDCQRDKNVMRNLWSGASHEKTYHDRT